MAQVKMKKKEIVAFWHGLNAASAKQDLHRRLAYGIGRNIGKLRTIIAALEESSKPLDEFEEQRLELANKMAKKDADGNPESLPGNQGVVIANMIEFNKRLDVIREETGQKAKDTEIEEMMEAEEEVDVYMVPYKCLPKTVSGSFIDPIMPMIEEPTEADFEDED